jgi:hypothetical protein
MIFLTLISLAVAFTTFSTGEQCRRCIDRG